MGFTGNVYGQRRIQIILNVFSEVELSVKGHIVIKPHHNGRVLPDTDMTN